MGSLTIEANAVVAQTKLPVIVSSAARVLFTPVINRSSLDRPTIGLFLMAMYGTMVGDCQLHDQKRKKVVTINLRSAESEVSESIVVLQSAPSLNVELSAHPLTPLSRIAMNML